MVKVGTPGPANDVAALANRGLVKVAGKLLPVSAVHQAGWAQVAVPDEDAGEGPDADDALTGETVLTADQQMKALTARTIEARTVERASSGLVNGGPAREAALAFTKPSQQIEAAAARGDMPEGAAALMARASRAGLDKLYSGPVPTELTIRQPYIAMARQGALDAMGHPETNPLVGIPAQPK